MRNTTRSRRIFNAVLGAIFALTITSTIVTLPTSPAKAENYQHFGPISYWIPPHCTVGASAHAHRTPHAVGSTVTYTDSVDVYGFFEACDLIGTQDYVPPRMYLSMVNYTRGTVSGRYYTNTLPGVNHDDVYHSFVCNFDDVVVVDVYFRAWSSTNHSYTGSTSRTWEFHGKCGEYTLVSS